MKRDWRDFKAMHSNLAGAREAFENVCETLFRKIYQQQNVKQVAVKQGDGGIDIFIGEIGVESIIVIQCKFFLEDFSEPQYAQIRNSFKKANNSIDYDLKEWILCVPRILPLDESSWWSKWKAKQIKKLNKTSEFISLKNGNELIDLLKEYNLYNQVFQIKDSLLIEAIHEKVIAPPPENNSTNELTFIQKINPKNIIGREKEITALNKLLHENKQVVVVNGMGGIGKTTLAAAYV